MDAPLTTGQKLHRAGVAVLAVLVIVGLAWWVKGAVSGGGEKAKRSVQAVQVIRPPPPPPPPEEPPPPPPDQPEEQIPQNSPDPAPTDDAPAAEQLGLDADGSAGGDAFGLAARKGGRDLTGGGGAAFAWYTSLLKDQVLDKLSDLDSVRSRRFSIVVRVWVETDGAVRRATLVGSTGDGGVDKAIENALERLGRLREGPPLEMPQPISLRIVSRS
jgi:protein TonB